MQGTIQDFKIEHFNKYKNAIIEIVKNNTAALVDEDIISLLKTPPLDSMDIIKTRILTLTKKNNIILDTEILSSLMLKYRKNLQKCIKDIRNLRSDKLIEIINRFDNYDSIIKLMKKDFIAINNLIRKIVKETIESSADDFLLKICDVFLPDTDEFVKSRIIQDFAKYMNGQYKRQLLENIDIKILVKDTTLINLIKEQTERYLFTLANSRLFKENI